MIGAEVFLLAQGIAIASTISIIASSATAAEAPPTMATVLSEDVGGVTVVAFAVPTPGKEE